MSPVTRDDVARRAGTSPAVVSYVLNNGPRPVAPATRARVENAMAELGYRPNLVARALRSARSGTVGLVVPDSTEPFFTELVHAVEQAAFTDGTLVLLGNSAFSAERERRYAETLASMRVDGLLVVRAEVERPAPADYLAALAAPLVFLNHRAPRGVSAPSVVLANQRGGRLAGEHLLGHGYRRIGCVTGTARTGPVAERARGLAAALRHAGHDAAPTLRTGLDRASARAQLRSWLTAPDRPDAIMATADGLAFDVLSVAAELGLRVPDEVAVIGFGGISAGAHSWPPLTTLGHPFADFGAAALDALKAAPNSAATRTLDVELIVRRSCGCP